MRYWKDKKTKTTPLISIVAAAYVEGRSREQDALRCFIYSLRAQTYKNWECIIIHDGPCTPDPIHLLGRPAYYDERIRFHQTNERKGAFGHPWRQMGIDMANGDIIGLTNADNYYVPVYLSELSYPILSKGGICVTYCDVVHSHKLWQPMSASLKRGSIDLACWLAEADLVKKTSFTGTDFAADWFYLEDIIRKAGKGRVKHVPGCLVVHN